MSAAFRRVFPITPATAATATSFCKALTSTIGRSTGISAGSSTAGQIKTDVLETQEVIKKAFQLCRGLEKLYGQDSKPYQEAMRLAQLIKQYDQLTLQKIWQETPDKFFEDADWSPAPLS